MQTSKGFFSCVSVDVSNKIGGFNGGVGAVGAAMDLAVGGGGGGGGELHGRLLTVPLQPHL